ncbi:ribosome maturation factor RimM [Murdochiella vaginalis]|uniref:ribosome maturation factor RimM n=1 Tax=Murdochiella vaginalis TaxID=1852373 RepID=UPI0008FDEE8D|nr:ribosome maturation factor RimM [Murdochiella vaginalis]
MKSGLIVVAEVLRIRGLSGEIKVRMADDRADRFPQGSTLTSESGRTLTVTRYRAQGQFGYLQFAEISSPEEAQKLVGESLLISEESLPKPKKDHYYVKDLLGMQVFREDESLLGILEEVIEYPAQDLYRIRTKEGKDILLPAVKSFIRKVDVEHHYMRVALIEGME